MRIPTFLSRPGTGLAAAVRRVRAFRRDEEGSLIIFGLFMFVIILSISGIAVDLLRHEALRARVQNTTDRAVLAAASLRQTQDAEAVVRDYFAADGLLHMLEAVDVDEGLNFRTVSATTRTTVPTFFMRLVGVPTLRSSVSSTAEERVRNIEISLVVDLSGSMNQFNRLENLQSAANEFVDTMFTMAEEGTVSISLVPYTGQVNAGSHILDYYDVAHRQEFSHCIDFDAADYSTTALPVGSRLQGAGHGFPWEVPPYSGYYAANDPLRPGFFDCPVAPGNAGLEILPFASDPAVLRNRINAMQALGATSIEIGMRWGVALVDPSVQPMVAGLAANGRVHPEFASRPAPFSDNETMKVVVLMTDGENFEERRLIDDVKSGPSNVWININDNSLTTYSLFNPATGLYWHRRDGQWHQHPWGAQAEETCQQVCTSWFLNRCWRWETQCTVTGVDLSNTRHLDWPELFNRGTMYWVARHIFAEAALPNGSNNQRNNHAQNLTLSWQTRTFMPEKDARLQQVCTAARQAGITVFSIAFEADAGGIRGLRDCATTPAHFFDVEGIAITDAFRAIASQINQLRLTQ